MEVEDLSESFCHVDGNKIFSINCLSVDGMLLENVEEKHRDNPAVVEVAMSQNPNSLQFASERLKDDEKFMVVKISQNPELIKFASMRIRDNAKVIKFVVQRNGSLLQYASDRLKRDVSTTRLAGVLGLRHSVQQEPTKQGPKQEPKFTHNNMYKLPLLVTSFVFIGAIILRRHTR